MALLVREGHDIRVVDSLETGHREAVHPSATFVQGDCGDPVLLDRVFGKARFDAVMHFAASIEAGDSMVHPSRCFVNNTARSLILADRMTAYSVDKLVFSRARRRTRSRSAIRFGRAARAWCRPRTWPVQRTAD